MKEVITQALVDKLLKSTTRVEVWDTKLPNFYLQARGSGTGTYYIRYTRPGASEKTTFRLGAAAVLSTADARALAQTTLARVAMGSDPADDKKRRKDCPTLQVVVDEYYIPHAKLTKKSWETDESLFRCHILPKLGRKSLSAITTSDIEGMMHSMRESGKAGEPKGRAKTKPSPSAQGYAAATCNRISMLLRYLFNLVIEKWKIPGLSKNPAAAVKLFPVNNIRQVFLTREEVGALVKAGAPKPGQQNEQTLSIVMFLVLTGVRKANALQAKWSEIDEARGLWNIPMTKSGKPQCLQLSNEVLKLLKGLSSRGKSEYLFPNPRTREPFVSIYSSWNSMRTAAGLQKVRMHDLRHTFASFLINGGASLFVVQRALGHSNPNVTMRYTHLSDLTQRTAIQNAATSLSGFLPA
jgi:integrase